MERQTNVKPKILFCYYLLNETNWKDGLSAALQILGKDYEITYANFAHRIPRYSETKEFDLILAWTAFETDLDKWMRKIEQPKGLLIAGYCYEPTKIRDYDVLFYETEWYAKTEIDYHPNKYHAFGVNTDIFKPLEQTPVIEYLSPGAFAAWKRHEYLIEKQGIRLAVGHIQLEEAARKESQTIIAKLLMNGIGVLPEVSPYELAYLMNASSTVFIPADVEGGGERCLLEARACGRHVEIREDNPKLQELLTSPVWDQEYYASQLRKGIESCLK